MTWNLVVDNMSFAYGKKSVLSNINFEIKSGEVVALLGRNGSGKSTLVKICSGLLKKYHNSVSINGQELKKIKTKERAQLIGYVPQSYTTNLSITVFEMIAMGLEINSFSSRSSYYQQISNIIEELGLADIANTSVTHLSGGQLQKTVIARALVKNPVFLMMDEPTSGLDLKNQRDLMHYLHKISRRDGVGSICISHDINLVSALSDKVIILKEGRILKQGKPEEVITPEILKKGFEMDVKIVEHLGRPHALML